MINKIREEFKRIYKMDASLSYFSPGRINLIGEHIDYNGGMVLPLAIDLGLYASLVYKDEPFINVVSHSFNNENIISFNLNDDSKNGEFTDYIKAIIYVYKKYYNVNFTKGFNLYIYSTLPASSGLSSSAAIEVLIANIINDYYNLNLGKIDLAIVSKKAETEFIGVKCGIMDQFACSCGKKDKAIILNTNNLEYEYVDCNFDKYSLIIINTNKPRNLITSKYNERRSECEKVLEVSQKTKKEEFLVNYLIEDLDKISPDISNTLYKRAKHVICENIRVHKSVDYLKAYKIKEFAGILNESHESLKSDYEVTGIELDVIQDELKKNELVLGSRMTGAGFGGCLIAVFDTTDTCKIDEVMNKIKEIYFKKTNLKLDYYFTKPSDGCKKI